MSNIAVRNHELQDATTFKDIFDVYMDALEEKSNLYRYEKEVARDSFCNLAKVAVSIFIAVLPLIL